MIQIDFNLPIASIALFGVAAACLAYICAVYARRLALVRRRERLCASADSQPGSLPSVTVVVFARSEPETLLRNLPSVLRQDYPAPFDVVVVNEGASPDTNMAVGQLKMAHPNIYLTFTPDGARSLSRKKLAITLGVKAAKSDVVVITEASARPESDQWLSTLMRSFADPATQVVIGYGAFEAPARRFAGRLTRIFDLMADSVAWMASAVCGKPCRACGFNVAYKRQLFFDNKGFSRSLNLRDGDDDIFISEIANSGNTAVELSPLAFVRKEAYPYMHETIEHRLSHSFTGRRVSKLSRGLMDAGEWCMWLALACCAAACWAAGWANAAAWIVAAVIAIATLAVPAVAWRKTIAAFAEPSWAIALPFQAMTRPLRNLAVNLRARFSRSAHYTWQ